jgi:membrane associated rhomboid family serine protease
MLVLLGFYVTTLSMPAYLMLGYWFLLQLLGGAVGLGSATQGGTAFWAHVGGFATGALLVRIFRDRELLARHPYHGLRGGPPGPAFQRRPPRDAFRDLR